MKKLSFQVGGMHCAACAAAVERAVKALPGASEVYVNIATNRMNLVADESLLSPETVAETVKKAGFEATLLTGNTTADQCIGPISFTLREEYALSRKIPVEPQRSAQKYHHV